MLLYTIYINIHGSILYSILNTVYRLRLIYVIGHRSAYAYTTAIPKKGEGVGRLRLRTTTTTRPRSRTARLGPLFRQSLRCVHLA